MQSILFLGFPNSGKSSLFNLLSGENKSTTNYSGATVSCSSSELLSNQKHPNKVKIIDLPGIYHLSPRSMDEAVTVSELITNQNYHGVAVVIDLERLEASLSLAMELKEVLGDKILLLLNKDDGNKIGNEFRKKLEELTGLKVLSTSSRRKNIRELDRFLRDHLSDGPLRPVRPIKITPLAEPFFQEKNIDKTLWESVTETELIKQVQNCHESSRSIVKSWKESMDDNTSMTKKIDSYVVHPFWGGVIFCSIFYFIFLSIYSWSGPLMDLIDLGTSNLGEFAGGLIPQGHLNSLVVDGIIGGVGGIIIFLPQIMILFFLFSLLEQCGYIARAAVVTDKIMSIFGLNGRSFLPYLSGFACSIPGIMAARTIPDKKERLATIMTIPLITCSARLPVYILLVGTFIPNETVFGVFNAQALSFFFLFFLGSFAALVFAKIFRLSFFKGQSSTFFMPLPSYQLPSFKLAWSRSLSSGMVFLKKAGTTIMVLSMIIWALSTFPEYKADGVSEEASSAVKLENSYMGKIGKSIEPILKPIGMDWKMGIGLLTAFGARELFVSTLGTIYALGEVDEESKTLRERLRLEKNELTGKPSYSLGTVWSLLIFFVFALQCISTLGIMKRELGGWKMPILAMLYMGVIAYAGSFVAYNLL